jgi:hypothetical protein
MHGPELDKRYLAVPQVESHRAARLRIDMRRLDENVGAFFGIRTQRDSAPSVRDFSVKSGQAKAYPTGADANVESDSR